MKKIYWIILVLFIVVLTPYFSKRELNTKIANDYVNSLNYPLDTIYHTYEDSIYTDFYETWDTVFLNFLQHPEVDLSSLNIDSNNQYIVHIWHGPEDRSMNRKNATIIINNWQFGPFAKTDVEVFAWEGTRTYGEIHICLLFYWIRIYQELTGEA